MIWVMIQYPASQESSRNSTCTNTTYNTRGFSTIVTVICQNPSSDASVLKVNKGVTFVLVIAN
jgi:hypothetical protein